MPTAELTEAQLAAIKDDFALTLSPEKLKELIADPNSEENKKARAVNLAVEAGRQKKIEENLEIARQNALIEKQLRETQPAFKKESQLDKVSRVVREYNLENAQTQQLVANLKKLQEQAPKLQDKLNTLLAQRNDILQKIEKLEERSQKLDERSEKLTLESIELRHQSKIIANTATEFQKAKTPQEQIKLLMKMKNIVAPGNENTLKPDQHKIAIKKLENNQTRQVAIGEENKTIEKERKDIVEELKGLKQALVENTKVLKDTLNEFQKLNKSIQSIEAKLGLSNNKDNSKEASQQEWMGPKIAPSLQPSNNKKKVDDEEYKSPSPLSMNMKMGRK